MERPGPYPAGDLPPAGRIISFESVGEQKKNSSHRDEFFFGDPERTRTVDLQRDRLAC